MSTEDQEICCHVTPLDEVEAEDDSFSCHMFSIEVVATFMPPLDDSAMEEEELELYDEECDVIQDRFLVERNKLFCPETSVSTIHQILLDMDIPVQPYMVDRILGFARQMASNKRYMGRKVLHMRVEIDVPPGFEAMDTEGDGDDDDLSSRLVPATKTAIEALEIIKIEDSTEHCMICLEELLIGSEVTRMPCSHLYHSGCILNWLEKSRACPLCRFEIA
ncbi:hypothetical protein P3X46_023282 [Hevea brasiliensis]|uniref:RING-type E3 ubiquitin transferase n=1 Tax=Hevea brasiliensis TaxID=3981 RepID=A0ABQ9LE86_HEVBR|nr:E3 ubiquitin-protein ligase CIP8-like [Hevea brasiliensis]KAJ9163633.1 hypothetical protein P3X46_023282 [Hevea brasiliensis]